MNSNGVLITSIHKCSNGNIYVERLGDWYIVCENTHQFSEIARWPEEYWIRHRENPPCKPPGFKIP